MTGRPRYVLKLITSMIMNRQARPQTSPDRLCQLCMPLAAGTPGLVV